MGFIEKKKIAKLEKETEVVKAEINKVAEEKKELEPTKKYKVVEKLPVQEVREYKDEEKNEIITFLTIDEALTMILNEGE